MQLKIGELAKRSGLSVRTLHHYDHIGLLKPSGRSEADYRLYQQADVIRLHRIQALRRLNLSLAEIAGLIDQAEHNSTAELAQLLENQLNGLEHSIASQTALRDRLKSLQGLLEKHQQLSLDHWLGTLEMMSVADRYFEPDELSWTHELHSGQKDTVEILLLPLIAATRALMTAGTAPDSEAAIKLAIEWSSKMDQILPDEPHYLVHMSEMLRNEPALQMLGGVDQALLDYVSQASIAVRYQAYRQFLSEQELRFFKDSQFRHRHDWARLFAEVREQQQQGKPASAAEVQVLLREWRALFADSWGNDPVAIQKARQTHLQQPQAFINSSGPSRELMLYAREGLIFLEQQIRAQNAKNESGTPAAPSASAT